MDEAQAVAVDAPVGDEATRVAGIDLLELGFQVTEHVATPGATHVVTTRRAA